MACCSEYCAEEDARAEKTRTLASAERHIGTMLKSEYQWISEGLAMSDNALSLLRMRLGSSIRLHDLHPGWMSQVESTRRHGELYSSSGIFQQIGGDSRTTAGFRVRTRRFSGVDRGHPINKIPAGASAKCESLWMTYSCFRLSFFHQLLVQKQT